MANRYLAALRTYTTRRDFWGCAAFSLIWYFNLAMGRKLGPASVYPILIVSLLPGFVVGMQLNVQFLNPLARLLPGFAAPHLMAAATVLAAALLVEVLLVTWIHATIAFPVAGFALTIAAVSAWGASGLSVAMSWLSAVAVTTVCIAPALVRPSTEWYLAADYPVAIVAAIGGSLAALAALGVRLWTLSEETAKHVHRMPASIWDFTSREGRRSRRQAEASLIARSSLRGRLYDSGLRLALRWSSAPAGLRRLLLHQAAGGFSGLFLVSVQCVLIVYLSWIQHWSQEFNLLGGGGLFIVSFFPTAMGVSMLGGLWLRRWPYLARESLYAVRRADFVRDLAADRACDMAGIAVGQCAGIVAVAAIFQLSWSRIGVVMVYLALTLVQYAAMYGVVLWLVSYRSFWILLVGTMIAAPMSAGLVLVGMLASDTFGSPAIAAAMAVGAAMVAGAWLLALRRWRCVELD